MRKTLRLFYGILRKELLLLYRYRVNTAAYLLTLYGFFLLIFFGGRTIGGDAFDDSLGAVIIGYFLVTMSFTAYNELAFTFSREAAWGTLEQLYMSEVGFNRTMVLIAIVQVLVSFAWGTLMLIAMLLTTGEQIAINLVSVVPIAVLAIVSVLGLGFAFGGAAVLYKRISSVFNLVQFVFLGLVAAPVEQYPLLKYLPLTQGSYLLQLVMEDGHTIWEIPTNELLILGGVAVGYSLLGYVVFDKFVAVARQRGVMGHY